MNRRSIRTVFVLACLLIVMSGCTWTIRASVTPDGTPGNAPSGRPSLSGDGRFIVFESAASDLVSGDGNGMVDVFVRDLESQETELVSVGVGGTDADGPSQNARISEDGRFVVFESPASNLVPDDTDGRVDVFVRDRDAGTTTRISDNTTTVARVPDISADGRFVVYEFGVVSGTPPFLTFPKSVRHDLTTNTSVTFGGINPSISDDGRFATFHGARFAGGPTGFTLPIVYVIDLDSMSSTMIADSAQHAVISGDGTWIAYETFSLETPSQIYRANRLTGEVQLVSGVGATSGNLPSVDPSISDNGRFVSFSSPATNLVPDDLLAAQQVFVRDAQTDVLSLVSRSGLDAVGSADSSRSDLSDDGAYVAFESLATNLDGEEQESGGDVYVRFRAQPVPTSMTPSVLTPGTTTTVRIKGQGFRHLLQVNVAGTQDVVFGPARLVLEGPLVPATVSLEVDVTVRPSAKPGRRHVLVTNFRTGAPAYEVGAIGHCACLTVSG
jgi:Tol biopolymer transport system component